VIGELDAHAVSTTGYAFDLVNQIGASAPRPRFRVRKNILSNRLSLGTDQQVTRCLPRGDPLPDGSGEYQSIARMIFQVTNVAGGVVTLADPAGRMAPIGITNQFQNWYLYRQKTGGTWLITASDPVAQTATLTVSPGTTPGTLAAGEFVELRPTEPAAIRIAARPLSTPLVATTACESIPYYSAAGGTGTRVVLKDAYDNTQPWPAFDGQYEDDFAIFYSQILASNNVTSTGSLARFEFPVSVASVSIGDLVYYGANNSATKPYGGGRSYLWEVTAIDTVNKYLFVKPHWTNHPGALPSIAVSEAFVIRAAQVFQILTTHAATHELEFTQTAPTFGSAGGEIVLIERRLGGGVLPNYLDHPTASLAISAGNYGVIARPLDKPGFRGEGNALPNPVFAHWATPANPPDGYSISGGGTSHSQNTDPALIKYAAGQNWLVQAFGSGTGTINVSAPVAYLQSADIGKLTRFALKVSLNLTQFRFDTKLSFILKSADGTFQLTLADFFSTDNTVSAPAKSQLAEGWQDIVFAGTDFVTPGGVGPGGIPQDWRDRGGLFLQILPNVANATSPDPRAVVTYVLDALAIIQVAYDPGVGVYPNGSSANALLQQGTAQLGAFAMPLPTYALTIADLERIPGSPYVADVLVKGGTIDLVDADMAIVDTPRLTRLVSNELQYTDSQLTLAAPPRWLTRLLAATSST
jgi:hypothetical protein